MDKIRVDGANGIRFNSARKRGAFTSGSPYNSTLAASASESLLRIPNTDINPNKAVFTIDSKTSNILIVNNNACELLGYRPSELCDMKFAALLANTTNKSYVSALAEGQLNSEDGTMVLLSGKVVEMNTKGGGKVAASLWIRQIDADGRCLAVAEPVERRVTQITIDKTGAIVSADAETLMLFQIDAEDDLIGMGIESLIPAIQLPHIDDAPLPKAMHKQKATGRTKDSLSFPLCLMIAPIEGGGGAAAAAAAASDMDASVIELFVVTVWVFQNISGLIVIDDTGSIELCNHHFTMLMFGYAQPKIVRMHITEVVPNFGKDFEYIGTNRSRNVTASSLDNVENEESETETDPVYYEADQSFYATPTGMTASDYSKSNYSVRNAIELANDSLARAHRSMFAACEQSRSDELRTCGCDLTKAISEPIQICLDDLESTDGYAADDCTASESATSDRGRMKAVTATVNKSMSDNLLTASCQAGGGERRGDRWTTAIVARTIHEPSDELNSFDTNEMLTPVNEKHISYKYLMSFDETTKQMTKQRANHARRADELASDAQRDVESDLSSDFSIVHVTDCIERDADGRGGPKAGANQTQAKSAPVGRRRHSEYLANVQQQPQTTSPQNLYNDGKYKGEAIHCDGNVINILYTVSSQELPCGRTVYCVWICRGELDADEEDEKHPNLTTFNSITSNVETSVDGLPVKRNSMNMSGAGAGGGGGVAVGCAGATAGGVIQSSRPNSVSLLSQCEDEQISGEYSKHYTTLKQIGKGAFGYVKMAFRHTDRLLVVTKFILKEKLPPQFMVITEDQKDVPMEVYLLSTVKHPNIVTVLDVFENEKFYQLVMEKHGSGMDLFEFIDRRPLMDEQLGSYIFRQIVNAVDYLHSLNILHRDIKDENIIIDQYFHVKLIDFGSATFMEKDKLFSTFYGTTEYCSPEVLAGNKYAGPELEIWSLGVTLFVLIFFENPFIDIEETLHSELVIPHTVSGALDHILKGMLDKSPRTRCTMKQLMADPWLTQDLSPCNFNFSWIVPCESHESNPDKYFNGQIYSSATGLSITSPHDSLSLADEEDSMIDAEEDIEDEELCDDAYNIHFKQELDYRKRRESSEPRNSYKAHESPDPLIESTTNATFIAAPTNTGKLLQLPVATLKHPPQPTSQCKRNHSSIVPNSPHPPNMPGKCPCSASASLTKIPGCAAAQPRANAALGDRHDEPCHSAASMCMRKESYSCDSIARTTHLLDDDTNDGSSWAISEIRETSLSAHVFGHHVTACNASLLSVTSSDLDEFDANCSDAAIGGGNAAKATCANSAMISLSKSETNISEQNRDDGTGKLQIFNVVSLNDLYENDPFLQKPMGDSTKNACTTLASDGDGMQRKKHNITLTNTITVAMRNTADVSDKTF